MVEEKVHALNDTYQLLMTTCQEKRDLFTVCVKFHMNVRQVSLASYPDSFSLFFERTSHPVL